MNPTTLFRALCAPLSLALAICLRLLLDPLLGTHFPLVTVYLAIVFTAWYAGLAPALVAVVLGYVASDYFLIAPRDAFGLASQDQVMFLVRYGVVGITTALLGGAMQRARLRAARNRADVQRQALLIDQLHDAVLVWEWQGSITFWNRGAELLYGFPRAQVLGRSGRELLSTEGADAAQVLRQLAADGRWEGEVSQLTQDGRRIWVETRMVLVRETQCSYVIETHRDVTARRALESLRSDMQVQLEQQVQQRTAELANSEQQFRALIEGIHGYAILMLDPSGVVRTWSKSAERIGGYRADEIIGQSLRTLFTPQDIERGKPEADLAQAQALGKLEIDGWRLRGNGTQYWVSGTLAALRDADNRLIGFVKVMRDVTEKRRNDELLYSVLDNAQDAIINFDMNGSISLFNRAGEDMFGRSASEVVGRNVRSLLTDASVVEYERYLHSHLGAGNPGSLGARTELFGKRKDGSSFPMDIAVTGFELDHQRYFICILRDLSERKHLEEQLRQSQKLDAFGQLAGGVAHDFNNLLLVISGYSSLLLSTLDAKHESFKFVSEIRRAGERATALTRQLLAFSRQQMLEPRVLDLNEVVKDMERMLLRVIGEDVQLSSTLAPRLSAVKIDAGQLEQVIMNLAVNARDAMPQGGRLTIETSEVAVDELYKRAHPQLRIGRFVVLAISDNGQGMASEVKARMFEPFFTTKDVGKGTGLGLAVVHGIVKQSGGHIEVHSETGLGTVFKIYLPAVHEASVPLVEVAPASSASGHETILLVEDDEGVRELVARSLQSLGYKVLQAVNGRAALQLLDTVRPHVDLLLTDVVMPEMSGRQLAEIFTSRYGSGKVMFVSGYTNDAVVRHGVQQAEAAFLQKPFTVQALAAKVRESLSAV